MRARIAGKARRRLPTVWQSWEPPFRAAVRSCLDRVWPCRASVRCLMQELARGSRLLLRADAADNRLRHAFAAPAAEGKTARERGTKLLVEFRTQLHTRAMQPGLHRLGQQTEKIGRLLDAHAFDNP